MATSTATTRGPLGRGASHGGGAPECTLPSPGANRGTVTVVRPAARALSVWNTRGRGATEDGRGAAAVAPVPSSIRSMSHGIQPLTQHRHATAVVTGGVFHSIHARRAHFFKRTMPPPHTRLPSCQPVGFCAMPSAEYRVIGGGGTSAPTTGAGAGREAAAAAAVAAAAAESFSTRLHSAANVSNRALDTQYGAASRFVASVTLALRNACTAALWSLLARCSSAK
jgi:hypothetical protein